MKSVQIRSFFTSDTGKYGPKKLCIWTLFTYSHSFKKFLKQKLMFLHSKFNRYFTLVIVCESMITTSFLWFGITSFENIHGINFSSRGASSHDLSTRYKIYSPAEAAVQSCSEKQLFFFSKQLPRNIVEKVRFIDVSGCRHKRSHCSANLRKTYC